MRNFQEKRGIKEIMKSKPALVLLGFIILIFTWSVLKLAGQMQETAQNKKLAEEKIAELTQAQIKLASDIDNLQTVDGKEEIIRDKFGLAKPGEGLIVVVDDQNDAVDQNSQNDIGFWNRIKSWFK